jgi:hypothetical protein
MGPADAAGTAQVAFEPASLALGEERDGVVTIRNGASRQVGPIRLQAGAVTTFSGSPVSYVSLQVSPDEIAKLDPDSARNVALSLIFTSEPQPGTFRVALSALLEEQRVGSLEISFTVAELPPAGSGARVAITAGPDAPRQGDVVSYEAEVRDSAGKVQTGAAVGWTISPASAGLTTADGHFVGYDPGEAKIIAAVQGAADTLPITIASRGLSGSFSVVGRGPVSARYTSDVWVSGDHAYTGTWNCRSGVCGDRLYVWDASDPGSPVRVDSILIDARTVNDVKIRADGTLGVITHEQSSDGLNGITLLDLTEPANPEVITRFTAGLTTGVHNVWIEGDYVYVAADGPGGGLRVVDVSDPTRPSTVASYYAGSSILHDVYVRDGLAFLSHWNAGLVILDVGNGVVGGSPMSPVEVGRIITAGGQVHNAWYWPAARYVFVGEEDFDTPGMMHVVDVSDLSHPKEVATFRVPGATPHNFWLDEDNEILFAAWYERGLRALDVSGVLLGELGRQGREIAFSEYGIGSGCVGVTGTCTWAPQLHDGLIYLSDMNTGLWILQADSQLTPAFSTGMASIRSMQSRATRSRN